MTGKYVLVLFFFSFFSVGSYSTAGKQVCPISVTEQRPLAKFKPALLGQLIARP